MKYILQIRPALEATLKKRLPESEFSGIAVPKCYHAVHRDKAESVLVLSDLRNEGYFLQPLTAGLTQQQTEAAVQCLAEFHAASYVYETKEKVDLKQKFPYLLSKEQAVESFQRLVDRGLPLLLKFLENKSNYSKIRSCLKSYTTSRVSETFLRMLSQSSNLNTLIHCDFWCNNLMFTKAKDNKGKVSCKIVDWQMITYGSPAIDLAMILSTSLSSEDRRNLQKEIISTYWKSFTTCLQKLGIKTDDIKCSLEDLMRETEQCQAHAGLLVVGSVDIALGDSIREERVLSLLSDLIDSNIL